MNTMIEMIKQLRNETGAGVMDCQMALVQASQNYETALAYLRESGVTRIGKQVNRETSQGIIELYSHGDGRVCAMVEINTETEFASRSEVFRQFAHEIVLQVTAASPLYVRDTDIPPQTLDELALEATHRARLAGKSGQIIERIVQGVLEKYKDKNVLLRQAYIRDEKISVARLLNDAISRTGENIVIRRFVRWELNPDSEAD
jgi:elongation factor Ts